MDKKKQFSEEDLAQLFRLKAESRDFFDQLEAEGEVATLPDPKPLPSYCDDDQQELNFGEENEPNLEKPKIAKSPSPQLQVVWRQWQWAAAANFIGLILSGVFIFHLQSKIKEYQEQITRESAENARLIAENDSLKNKQPVVLPDEPLPQNQSDTSKNGQVSAPPEPQLVRKNAIEKEWTTLGGTSTAGSPNSAKSTQRVAEELFKKGKYAQAEVLLESILDRDEPDFDVLNNWLVCQALQLPKSRAWFEKNIGEALQKGFPDETQKKLEKLRQLTTPKPQNDKGE